MSKKLITLNSNIVVKDEIVKILKRESLKPLPEQEAYDRYDFLVLVFHYTQEEIRNSMWTKGIAKYYHYITEVLEQLVQSGEVKMLREGRTFYYIWKTEQR